MELLLEMLRYKRRHKTKSERRFTRRFLDSVEGMQQDPFGNRHIQIGEPNGVLFSSHIDTVHPRSGMQRVVVDEHRKEIFKDDKNPLGADDAAGMWLMLNMIEEGVEGLYVFHRGEERGGLGSNYIRKDGRLLEGITKAIAFDRRGNDEVITHQGSRCCSDKFANDLCSELAWHGLVYNRSDSGIFTDTANYMDVVPECTNIGVGYENEHTAWETLDYGHLLRLRDVLIKIDWASLSVDRDPTVIDYAEYNKDAWNSVSSYATGGYESDMTYDQMYDWVYYNPDAAAGLLLDLGVGSESCAMSNAQVDAYLDEASYKS